MNPAKLIFMKYTTCNIFGASTKIIICHAIRDFGVSGNHSKCLGTFVLQFVSYCDENKETS